MQHLKMLEQASLQKAWLTIGSFDGVHRGHQAIIGALTAGARTNAAPAVVLTFYPHPAVVLRGRSAPFYLTSPDQRAETLGELGVDVVLTLPFTPELAATPARDFVSQLKQRLGFSRLMVGRDFALGRNRAGDIPTLKQLGLEYDFQVEVIPPVMAGDQVISSRQIRVLLAEGDVQTAADWLGRPYRVSGKVIHGDGRGRSFGIPTANLSAWPEQLLPSAGVYACRAAVGGVAWAAAVNLGVRPTFDGKSTFLHVEAHLLGFDGDLYAQTVSLDFIARLREEQRFPSQQALIAQIQQDIVRVAEIVKTGSPA